MRFCPFCSAENSDELAVCQACGRRLPPVPPRRAGSRSAPPTGIQLPPRAPGSPTPAARRTGNTLPPPVATPSPTAVAPATPIKAPAPSLDNTWIDPEPSAETVVAPPPIPDKAPPAVENTFVSAMVMPESTVTVVDPPDELPDLTVRSAPSYATPPHALPVVRPRDSAAELPPPPPDPAGEDARRQLVNAINPGPAALRREATPEERIVADRRAARPSQPPPPPSTPPGARAHRPSQAPPIPSRAAPPSDRARSPSTAPPPGDRARSPSTAPPPGDRARSPSQAPPPSDRWKSASPAPPPSPPTSPPPSDRARSPSSAPGPGERPSQVPPPSPSTLPSIEPSRSPSQASSAPPPARAQSPSRPPSSIPLRVAASRPSTDDGFGGDTFLVDNDTKAAPQLLPAYGADGPPPTRIHRPEALADRPFTPPQVLPVPAIPEPGIVKAAKYAYVFAVARWQRRGAIKQLGVEIKQDTEALDQVLGALGRSARGARVEGRVFSAENSAISNAEERVNQLNKEHAEVEGRKAEENSKFVDIERERNAKLLEAEHKVDEATRELANLEAQRRSLRDRRKEYERRQRANMKAADDYDRQSGSAPMGEQRQELRKVAEGHRREAAALEPERKEIDGQLAGLERPVGELNTRLESGKAELDTAKRSLNDAREGHTHRLAELDAEQKRKMRERSLAESEITRRLVTLGTLVNLNRIEDPQFIELYQRIDRLRSAITSRTTEIEKLTAEREAYDRGTLVRGIASIGGAVVGLIALIVILKAIL